MEVKRWRNLAAGIKVRTYRSNIVSLHEPNINLRWLVDYICMSIMSILAERCFIGTCGSKVIKRNGERGNGGIGFGEIWMGKV